VLTLWVGHFLFLTLFEIRTVSRQRLLVLLLGPVLLVGACYWVTFELPRITQAAPTTEPATELEAPPFEGTKTASAGDLSQLDEQAHVAAADLIRRLGEQHRVIVKTPFVLAGNLSEADLQRNYHSTIEPIVHALKRSYFQTPPNQPISIVMLTNVDQYRRVAEQLDHYDAVNYHGYYQRGERRIVLDLSSGNGTLAHEVTHALMAFDFPEAPEWFDEGLASLHEQGQFSEDGETLIGHHNWRLLSLQQAMQSNQIKPIETLVSGHSFRQEGEGLHYAQVRYLCLYLQQEGLLKTYYHRFRGSAANDPTGLQTLIEALGVNSAEDVDNHFRFWLRHQLKHAKRAQR